MEMVNRSWAPRLSAVSGIAGLLSAGGAGVALAIARNVSIISLRLASSCNVARAALACSGVNGLAAGGDASALPCAKADDGWPHIKAVAINRQTKATCRNDFSANGFPLRIKNLSPFSPL
ncbi:hypothetical protein [Afipia felis]|uniref:hypothetical protein n=1 Tax=Afipia felis TaxID=1035 RepID=UPI003D32321D